MPMCDSPKSQIRPTLLDENVRVCWVPQGFIGMHGWLQNGTGMHFAHFRMHCSCRLTKYQNISFSKLIVRIIANMLRSTEMYAKTF